MKPFENLFRSSLFSASLLVLCPVNRTDGGQRQSGAPPLRRVPSSEWVEKKLTTCILI